jgi:glucose-6-phosphate-specific signal transduction histidine kinase
MQTPASAQKTCPLDERERFTRFYEVIPEVLRAYTANFGWTVGLLSAVIGWIISSETTRAFIGSNPSVYYDLILAVVLIGLLHTAACWNFYQISQKKIAQLTKNYTDLEPLPFEDYRITGQTFVINLLISWALLISLIVMLSAAH